MSEKAELPTTTTTPERCETCRFWKMEVEDTERGECRRMPPAQNLIRNLAVLLNLRDIQREEFSYSEDIDFPYDGVALPDDGQEKGRKTRSLDFEADWCACWPTIYGHEWCGEWRAKANHPTPEG